MTFDLPYGFNFLHLNELTLLIPLAFLVFLGLWRKINRRHLFVHSLVIFLLILALPGIILCPWYSDFYMVVG